MTKPASNCFRIPNVLQEEAATNYVPHAKLLSSHILTYEEKAQRRSLFALKSSASKSKSDCGNLSDCPLLECGSSSPKGTDVWWDCSMAAIQSLKWRNLRFSEWKYQKFLNEKAHMATEIWIIALPRGVQKCRFCRHFFFGQKGLDILFLHFS